MAHIKKLTGKILIIILDILLFSFSIARQIALPARRKKGNLLYSLFIFFVGVIERIGDFEHGVFDMANFFRRKYIKQSLLIVASLLFLLSSLEWTGEKILYNNSYNYTEQFSSADLQKETVFEQGNIKEQTQKIFAGNAYPAFKNVFCRRTQFSASIKGYLLFRSIRI